MDGEELFAFIKALCYQANASHMRSHLNLSFKDWNLTPEEDNGFSHV